MFRVKKQRKWTALILIAALICVLCGCGEKNEKEKVSALDAEYMEIHPITDIKEGRDDVYMILKACSNSYWESVINGGIKGGNEIDCNLYLGATFDETNWERQQLIIEEAVDRGADAIVLAPVNAVPIIDTLSRVKAMGIPVILIDTIIEGENFDVCYMTENLQAGEFAAKEMIEQLKASGKTENDSLSIGIQAGATTSQTIVDRVAGFMGYWTSNAPKNWKIIDDVKVNSGDLELAQKYCDDFLKDYSDLAGIFATNNGSTVGSVRGINESGRNDIVMIGFDYSAEISEMINSKKCRVSTILQNQYNMGYNGVKITKTIDDINFKFVDTGVTIVNQENIFDEEIQKALEVSG